MVTMRSRGCLEVHFDYRGGHPVASNQAAVAIQAAGSWLQVQQPWPTQPEHRRPEKWSKNLPVLSCCAAAITAMYTKGYDYGDVHVMYLRTYVVRQTNTGPRIIIACLAQITISAFLCEHGTMKKGQHSTTKVAIAKNRLADRPQWLPIFLEISTR